MCAKKAVIVVMDSFGIGATEDAFRYGDEGADTLGHIVERAHEGRADGLMNGRHGDLRLPCLDSMGLSKAACLSRGGRYLASPLSSEKKLMGAYGYAVPRSVPKDSTAGHWEIAGLPTLVDWGYLCTQGEKTFPKALTEALIQQGGLSGLIECGPASGTEVIKQFGEEHIKTGKPIAYTSADSVFQIAAHEGAFGLDRLYELCGIARKLVDRHQIARVIARPFVGTLAEGFTRTRNRRDFSMPPNAETLLDALSMSGVQVIGIGKISDLFAGQGISNSIDSTDLDLVVDAVIENLSRANATSLIFANLTDFDSKYGHRRDVIGYATELERFDQRLPEIISALGKNDILIITGDHGCDPTYKGTDHTREHVPVLVAGNGVVNRCMGQFASFTEIGRLAAVHLGMTVRDLDKFFEMKRNEC